MIRPPVPPKRLLLKARKQVTGSFAGQYRSAFRGAGLDFEELRPYQYGDDVRAMNWSVTARTGTPYIKLYREERELNLFLLLDLSASQGFGTAKGQKWTTALEVAALLTYGALENRDRLGIAVVTDHIEMYRPLSRGSQKLMGTLSALEHLQLRSPGTDLGLGLDFTHRVLRRPSIVVIITDLLDEGYERSLLRLHSRHETILLHLHHPEELAPAATGILPTFDLETGHAGWRFRPSFRPQQKPRTSLDSVRNTLANLRKRYAIESLSLDVTQNPLHALQEYLLSRHPTTQRR
jgi:uncharacterized protein (DUF58 family)